MARILTEFKLKLENEAFRVNFTHTVFVFYCAIVAGITSAVTGPALLDLQLITGTNTEQSSAFITGASAGSIIGSLGVGVIYWRCNKVLLMLACFVLNTAVVVALPWCSVYPLMIVMHGFMEMMRSAFCAAASLDVIRTWTTDSRIYLQIFNVCFSLGGMLAPIIVQPFLLPREELNVTKVTNASFPPLTASADTADPEESKTQIYQAYLILGGLYIVGIILLFSEYICFRKYDYKTQETEAYASLDKPLPLSVLLVSMTLVSLVLFFMMSVHISLISFILTFVVTFLNWRKASGANLTTVYWVCQAVWRFITIFFTRYVSPYTQLLCTSILTLAALVGSIFFSLYGYSAGLWVCIGLCGLGISSNIPSIFLWTEESIAPVSPSITSGYQVAITIPGIITPQIVGYLMEQVTPMWLLYLCALECGCSLAILILVQVWVRVVVKKHVMKESRR